MAVTQETYPQAGPFPEHLRISQHCAVNIQLHHPLDKLKKAEFAGEITRQWRLDDTGLFLCAELDTRPLQRKPESRVFHAIGSVRFYIAPDRKLVVISSVLGPRWGWKRVYQVVRQGKRGELWPQSRLIADMY